IVAAAANGYDQVVLAAKIDRGDDVRHIAATGDQAGPPIDHGVIDLSSRVVTRVALFDELSAEAGFEGGNGRFVQHDFLLNQNRPRRFMSDPPLRRRHLSSSTSTLIGAETGIESIAAVHSQCRSWVIRVISSVRQSR